MALRAPLGPDEVSQQFEIGAAGLVKLLAQIDASLPSTERQSVAMLLAARPWVFSLFSQLKRKPHKIPGKQQHAATVLLVKLNANLVKN